MSADRDAKRFAWIRDQVARGFNVEIMREMAEFEDGSSGLCVMVYRGPQAGPEEGCYKYVAGNDDFDAAIDDAIAAVAGRSPPDPA